MEQAGAHTPSIISPHQQHHQHNSSVAIPGYKWLLGQLGILQNSQDCPCKLGNDQLPVCRLQWPSEPLHGFLSITTQQVAEQQEH